MQLVKNSINRSTGKGDAVLIPKEPEDMWHLYNLIRPGDVLRASAHRKVKTESRSAGTDGHGSTQTRSVVTTFSILVARLDFDPLAGELHVAGRICEQNPYTEMWAHHTLDLELDRKLTLTKGADIDAPALDTRRGAAAAAKAGQEPLVEGGEGWDSVALEILQAACDPRRVAESYAIIMDEGMANICMLTQHQTSLRQRVDMPIARKRRGPGADAHDRSMDRFYDAMLKALRQHVDIDAAVSKYTAAAGKDDQRPPPLVVASPGFFAASFVKHMQATAQRTGDKPLATYARDSVIVAHSSSGHLHSLDEALKAPSIASLHADKRWARETVLMDRFMALMREDNGLAWYGPREVERAVDQGAVGRGGGVLLLSDRLFRSADVATRRRWVALRDRVADVEGGEVRVLSSSHTSGKKLEALGDVAAILTYPIEDLDEDAEENMTENHITGNGTAAGELEPNRNHELAV